MAWIDVEAIPVTRWLFWMFLLCGVFFALLAAQGCGDNTRAPLATCEDLAIESCAVLDECGYLQASAEECVEYVMPLCSVGEYAADDFMLTCDAFEAGTFFPWPYGPG